MQTFCTIITSGHLPFARVLHKSLHKNLPGTELQVLVIDKDNIPSIQGITFYSLHKIKDHPLFNEIEKKYGYTNKDHFRWALKPLFISYLLKNGFSKVLFADADLYFVNNFKFLFDELDKNNILLSPHWPNINPLENEDGIFSVLRGGLFNAGFIGSNKDGIEAIDWWAKMCHYKMEKRLDIGVYDDQKYLDILSIQFPNVLVVRHQGCNLASWNIDSCKRELINGKIIINNHYEPVFIHFAKDTIINILNKNDILLKPYLDEYIHELAKENFDLIKNLNTPEIGNYNSSIYSIKHKLRLRTRLKRFFFKIAEKL